MRSKQAKPKPIKQKYRSYSPTYLHNAYKFVKEEKMSVCKAARLHGVPEQTLRDRVKGKIDPECVTTGREPLSLMDEAKVIDHLKNMAKYGYGYSKQETVDIASEFAIRIGKRTADKPLTMAWFEGFRKRWPEVKVQKPRALDHVRAKMANRTKVQEYFANLEQTLRKHNLIDKPRMIFNVDEKGISIDHKPPHIVHVSANPPAVTSGRSKTITVLGCGSASGVAIPPFFVFPGKRMMPELLQGATPGTDGTVSESGWSNGAVFRVWIEHFLKYIPGCNDDPVLLILGGHKSHTSIGVVEWALQLNIIIFVFPASHILQPMDVACFGPFQKIYNFSCHKFMRQTFSVISRYNVCELACTAYSKALSPDNLQASFRRTGIYPLDMSAIPSEAMTPAEIFASDCTSGSQATNNGPGNETAQDDGIIDDGAVFFNEKEDHLKEVKSKSAQKKPRNTMSVITSGREISSSNVLNKMKEHEQLESKPHKDTFENRPGPSTSISGGQVSAVPQDNPVSNHDNDSDSEADTCCVCGRIEPIEVSRSRKLIITNWVQCDGKLGINPCLHWVHLKYCSLVERVNKHDKFYCPHCVDYEE